MLLNKDDHGGNYLILRTLGRLSRCSRKQHCFCVVKSIVMQLMMYLNVGPVLSL